MSEISDDPRADGVKPRLLTLLQRAHAQQRAFVAGLSDAERAELGTSERWSAKDHLAHTTTWRARTAERLRAVARGEAAPATDEGVVQGINARTFAANRARSWDDVLAEDAHVHAELLAAVAALSEAELAEPDRFAWHRPGEPLLTDVLGTPYEHIHQHLAQYYRDRGDVARARQIHEDWVAAVNQPGLPAVARAIAVYNLACFYALSGDADAAIARLAAALRLSPQLAEWSKQDQDFDAIRDRADFQAIFAP